MNILSVPPSRLGREKRLQSFRCELTVTVGQGCMGRAPPYRSVRIQAHVDRFVTMAWLGFSHTEESVQL